MTPEVNSAVVSRVLDARTRGEIGFGRIRPDDPKNAAYPMRAVNVAGLRRALLQRTSTLPDRKTWYLRRAEQIDQGNTPYCVEAAARHVHLAYPLKVKDPEPFGALYREAKKLDGYPDVEGTDANAMLKVLRARGCVASWWWYTPDQDPELLDRWLLTTGPVMFGVMMTDLMLQTDDRGMVEVGDGPFYIGHEMALVGFDRTTKRTQGVQSWGTTNYGKQGRFWLSYEDRATLMDPAKGWGDVVGVVDQQPSPSLG